MAPHGGGTLNEWTGRYGKSILATYDFLRVVPVAATCGSSTGRFGAEKRGPVSGAEKRAAEKRGGGGEKGSGLIVFC